MYTFASQKKQKASINAIVTDPVFWHEVQMIVIGMFPVLKCLWLVDSNTADMDKLYYYVQCTSEALHHTKHLFNGEEHHLGFKYHTEIHTALGNATEASFSGDLRYLDKGGYDFNFEDDDEFWLVASFEDDGTISPTADVDLEDGNLVTSYTINGAVVPPTLWKCLSNHIEYLL
jgi:hypothetical protein